MIITRGKVLDQEVVVMVEAVAMVEVVAKVVAKIPPPNHDERLL